METQTYELRIESDLRPEYYDTFRCLAAECKISCCTGWSITFNKKDYLALKRQKGSPAFCERMKNAIRRVRNVIEEDPDAYAEFIMDSGICPLLREDCLCELQIQKGHAALPVVCQTYPRTEMNMPSGFLERSLSPSCMGVLRLLWEQTDGIGFLSDPLPKQKWRMLTVRNAPVIMANFQEIRAACIDILQDRRFPLAERILRLGALLKELSDGETDIPCWLEHGVRLSESTVPLLPPPEERTRVLPMFLNTNLRLLLKIPNMEADFRLLRAELVEALQIQLRGDGSRRASIRLEPWLTAQERLEKRLPEFERFMENLMTAVFFHMHMPVLNSGESIWKGYVNFCNLYAFYRFASVLSFHEKSACTREVINRVVAHISRSLIHSTNSMNAFRDEFFQNDSATLAHMAILLSS